VSETGAGTRQPNLAAPDLIPTQQLPRFARDALVELGAHHPFWQRHHLGRHPCPGNRRASLEAGVHIKAVADLLGHSSISITGDIYGHTSDATTRPAIDGLTSALGL